MDDEIMAPDLTWRRDLAGLLLAIGGFLILGSWFWPTLERLT